MALYGYARASTLDQDVAIQEDALRRAGRSELALLLRFHHPGDTPMVTHVDRLTGSIKGLQDIMSELRVGGVALKATEQPIDTATSAGKAFLDRLGVFAEFRPTCAGNSRWKTSPGSSPGASTGAAGRRSTRWRAGG
jgi:DNA invertase Pin-like site-specific DNA recombinase